LLGKDSYRRLLARAGEIQERRMKAQMRQRRIQKQVSKADAIRPLRKAPSAMQTGAQDYLAPPFPKQHQSKPGSEQQLNPEEIAPAYVVLATSQCSSYITGEILPIIGGYSGG
jgi:hypothetical protein